MEAGHLANLARRLGDVEGWEVLHDAHPARALIDMARATRPWPTALLVLATFGVVFLAAAHVLRLLRLGSLLRR